VALAGNGQGLEAPEKALPHRNAFERDLSLLVNMGKNAGLPWDCILSAELFQRYKPDPEIYLGAARLLDLKPEQMMMVAAHKHDLHSAAQCGMKTAFVKRPLEFGRKPNADLNNEPTFNINAVDVNDLASQLGCQGLSYFRFALRISIPAIRASSR